MKKFALFAVIVAALAFPALALAKKFNLSGGVVKDKDSRISLTVTMDGKEPKKITHFKLRGIDFSCKVQGKNQHFEDLGNVRITGALSVNKTGSFKARLPNVDNPKEKLRVSGIVKNRGKRVSGNVKSNKLTIAKRTCTVPKQHYELTK